MIDERASVPEQALLEAGANVDVKSGRRYHLMDEAVLTGDRAIVRQASGIPHGDWLGTLLGRVALVEVEPMDGVTSFSGQRKP